MKVTTPIPRLPYRVEPVYRGTLDVDAKHTCTLSDKQGGKSANNGHPATFEAPNPFYLIAGGHTAPCTGGLVDVRI